jgi:selenide,water dikinase
MAGLKPKCPPEVLAGTKNSEDAGVFRLSSDLALVQTLDFLTPMVDDPMDFGRIAAANSLSDVYAMGARPITALNIVCFPAGDLPESLLQEVLAGGLEKIEEAGAVLLGGHSVEDREFKYGLSVTGLVHPQAMVRNGGARKGDVLILTKPIGTGVLITAIKAKLASSQATEILLASMKALNAEASEIFCRFGVHAMTDITGFGLAGHALEMARASACLLRIETSRVPLLPEVLDHAAMGLVPGGAYRNRDFCGEAVVFEDGLGRSLKDLMVDPQTSGGLLAAVDPKMASDCLKALQDAGIGAALMGSVTEEGHCGAVFFG